MAQIRRFPFLSHIRSEASSHLTYHRRGAWRGYSAVSRDGRSQHQNKAKALERLQTLVQAAEAEAQAGSKADAHARHRQLERGNPRRVFFGPDFVETIRT